MAETTEKNYKIERDRTFGSDVDTGLTARVFQGGRKRWRWEIVDGETGKACVFGHINGWATHDEAEGDLLVWMNRFNNKLELKEVQ